MSERDQQLARFREAVQRKATRSGQSPQEHPHGAPAGTPPGEHGHSPREQGHGKDKTAERWNRSR
jgi:hypothetical protein